MKPLSKNPFPSSTPLPEPTAADGVKDFFRNDLKGMIRQFLSEPISGTYALFEQRAGSAYFQSLVLTGTTAVLYIVVPYLVMGRELRQLLEASDYIKAALLPIVFILAISALSFGIKSVSGKSDFKSELFTGALNAFPLSFFLLLVAGARLFTDIDLDDLEDPSGLLSMGTLLFVALFYLILMMINILQQSLKASGTKDALAYYISPVGVLLAWYLTYRVWMEFVL